MPKTAFGQTPVAPKEPPLISYNRKSTLEIAKRPGDRITIEEMRLDLAVKIGPYRLFAGKSNVYTLAEGIPTPIIPLSSANGSPGMSFGPNLVPGVNLNITPPSGSVTGRGANGLPTFIRVEVTNTADPLEDKDKTTFPSAYLEFSNQPSSIFRRTKYVADYVDLIVLSGETLWVTAYDISTTIYTVRALEIKVTEVLI